jgi:hypothetical protein
VQALAAKLKAHYRLAIRPSWLSQSKFQQQLVKKLEKLGYAVTLQPTG